MDDANLAKLSVNQPGLKPEFDKNIVKYELVVASNVDALTVKSVPSDKGASITTKSPSGYGESVQLKEGLNEIVVEVTSEDGTVKKYFVNCKRLSASDANLKSIDLSSADLMPKFDPTQLEYRVNINFRLSEMKFKCDLFDSSCSLDVLGNKKPLSKSEDSFYALVLNFGYSEILFKVTSPNKANSQTYKIEIIRDVLPRIGFFQNIKTKLDYEDPITSGPIHCSVKQDVKSNSLTYSSQVIDVFRKIALPDKLNRISLHANQSDGDELKVDVEGENKLAELALKVPYLNGSHSKELSLKHLFQCVDEANNEDQFKLIENEPKFENIQSVVNFPDNFPAYQVKPWEKQLQIIYDETDAEKLIKMSGTHFEKYISIVNSNNSALFKNSQNDSPLYYLNMSIFNLATSLKHKNNNYQTHFRLALLLEEKSFYESLYGAEKSDEQKEVLTLNSQNKMAAESSKDEEIEAICRAHGVAATASDAEKLKALDQEYHHLIETQQNAKAEQVQLLYQFKSKKIISNNKSSTKLIDDKGNYLVQAHLKYLDGIKLVIDSKTTNFNAYLSMGRSFCQIGDYLQALGFLKHCINWSDKQMQSISRFYFAYALCKQDNQEVLKSNSRLVVYYLSTGLQLFLASLCSSLSNRTIAIADDFFSIFNTMFLEGFVLLGKVKQQFQVNLDSISAEHSFKYASWLSCLALVEISKRSKVDKELRNTSQLISKLISILIEAHFLLINLEMRFDASDLSDQRDLVAKRCINLIDLIRSSTERNNLQILKLQEKVGELLVYVEPLNSYNLLLNACSKLELYDFLMESKGTNESELAYLLDESKNLLNASIEYEANANLDNVSNLITDQSWWKKLVEELSVKAKQAETTRVESASKKQSINKINPTTINKAQIGSKPASNNKAQQVKKPATTPAPAKNAKPVQVNAKPDCKKPSEETASKPSQEPVERKSSAEAKKELEQPQVNYKRKPNMFDKSVLNIQIQLCTARTYSRLKEFDNAKACYEKCIKLDHKSQDAYIELATMLKQNGDMMGAVDVYSMYPVDEKILNPSEKSDDSKRNQNFDDAFIYGELVTLLINSKQYDDPRLPKYLILWAKIMGTAIIDKYIGILDKANKTKICKQVYAGVHNKSVEDADLVQFFKFKGWF